MLEFPSFPCFSSCLDCWYAEKLIDMQKIIDLILRACKIAWKRNQGTEYMQTDLIKTIRHYGLQADFKLFNSKWSGSCVSARLGCRRVACHRNRISVKKLWRRMRRTTGCKQCSHVLWMSQVEGDEDEGGLTAASWLMSSCSLPPSLLCCSPHVIPSF